MANDCIPLFRPGQDVTGRVTAGSVAGKTFVKITEGTDPKTGKLLGIATATAAQGVLGVAAFDAVDYKDGEQPRCSVICGPGHVVPVVSGGIIAAFDEVEVGAGGKAVKAGAGVKVGRAWSASDGNGDVFIELY